MSTRPVAARAQATELFAALGGVTSRPMMGGYCFYADGRLFAAVRTDDRIYLRASAALGEALVAAGGEQLTFTRPSDGKVTRMGYWTLPDAALDDPEVACEWARRALAEETD